MPLTTWIGNKQPLKIRQDHVNLIDPVIPPVTKQNEPMQIKQTPGLTPGNVTDITTVPGNDDIFNNPLFWIAAAAIIYIVFKK